MSGDRGPVPCFLVGGGEWWCERGKEEEPGWRSVVGVCGCSPPTASCVVSAAHTVVVVVVVAGGGWARSCARCEAHQHTLIWTAAHPSTGPRG